MRPWLLAGLSGVLLIFSFPPHSYWLLAFVALLPLLRAAVRAPDWRGAANLGAVAGLVFYCTALSWMNRVFGPTVVAFWCLFALWIALFAAVTRAIHARWGKGWFTILSAALVWTGAEYFRCEVWYLNNAWLALGFSQHANIPLLQSASVIGVYGLTFLIAAFNLALALDGRKAAGMAACIAVLYWVGHSRVAGAPSMAGRPIKVALVQDEAVDLFKMARMSREGLAKDADLIVWPEDSLRFYPGGEDYVLRPLKQQLKGSRAHAVIGMYACPDDLDAKGIWKNQAWLISPEGKKVGVYDKHHPIPFVEKYIPANRDPKPVDSPLGRLGIQICYDFDFEDGSRLLAAQGAELLVVPDMDPMEWSLKQHEQHSSMAPLRSVETGLWTVRAASSGISQIINPRGTVLASMEAGKSAVLTGEAKLFATKTFYVRYGWLFGPFSLCYSILMLIFLAFSPAKKR